jgi:Ser/Thr protein kinase RdoA (MazF antagonist)
MERARLCITQLAGLHAWSANTANTAVLEEFPPLDTPIARDLFLPAFGPGWQVYLDKSPQPVPSKVAGYADRFAEYAPSALAALTERSMLLHGDIRADNMFFDGDRLKVVDFQFAARGAGVADIAYLVSQGLPTEVRRGHDEALVREYLQHLAAHVAYSMLLPVIILIGWDGLPERSRALCLKLTERAVATIDDIDALEVFG